MIYLLTIKMLSKALAGQVFDKNVCRVGQWKQPQNQDCPAQIGTVGNYAVHSWQSGKMWIGMITSLQ